MAGFQVSRRSTILQSLLRKRRQRRNRWKPSFPVYDNIPIFDPEIHEPKPRKSPSPAKCGLLSVPNTSYRITNHSKKGQCLDCDSHGITINKTFNSSHADVLSQVFNVFYIFKVGDSQVLRFIHGLGNWGLPRCLTLKTCIRILYGRRSKREEVPWHVGLYYNDNRYNEFLSCGGTLISSLKMVTAAHCFGSAAANALKRKRFTKNSGSYKVDAGDYTINGYQYKFRAGYKLFNLLFLLFQQ